jgi:hypothetical protein
MQLLEMVNNILPHLGEAPVTSIDTSNPTVNLIVRNIEDQRVNILAEGWWFNTTIVELQADAAGELRTPINLAAYYPTDCTRIEPRGKLMYDLDNRTFIHPANKKYRGRLVENLQVEEMPTYAARLVMYRAATECYMKDFGVDSTTQALTAQADTQQVLLTQEHLRKAKLTMNGKALVQYLSSLNT